jgi:hypothetical protein
MMHEVVEITFGVTCRTRVYLSEQAAGKIEQVRDMLPPGGPFWRKLKRYAISGFEHYERGNWPPLIHEWGGVYRIGFRDGMLRLIGFYDGGKSRFIVIDCLEKSAQQLSAAERRRVGEVVRVKNAGDWRISHEQSQTRYPRLAE